MLLSLSLLVGCANDFAIQGIKDEPEGLSDTAAPADTAVDEAPAEDTATTDTGAGTLPSEEPDEEPEETVDTGSPVTDTGTVETPDDPPPEDDCTETDDLIYVLDRDNAELYTFDPSSLGFTSLGRLRCGGAGTPGSMAVDRAGTAYVRYSDDSVYAVDLATLSCTATSYSDRRTGFDSFGMGYATDSADTWRDQLYVANEDTLGVLDPSTWTITTLGRMPSQSELTGNADGELWAILPLEEPAELVRLDKATGARAETLSLRSFPDPGDIDTFAFATWGGDFYVFVRLYGMGSTTDVYMVTRTGTMTKVLTDVGFDVVGAGVSTCAPTGS